MLTITRAVPRSPVGYLLCSHYYSTRVRTDISSNNTEAVQTDQPQLKTPLNTTKKQTASRQDDLSVLEQGIKRTCEISLDFTDYKSHITSLPPNFGLNQNIAVDKDLENELQSIVNSFNAPIEFAMGYGSGVFAQAGYGKDKSQEKPQVDMIFGVRDPVAFHETNLKQNPHHYSGMKVLGSKWISSLQGLGAGIYFNPFVQINGHQVKYGVVEMSRVLRDLAQWDTFYLAGRLQKPVRLLRSNHDVIYWNQVNLRNAATLAKHLTLTKHNGTFDEFQFYREITALSYLGDIRYALGGENPNKIDNIVTKNFEKFQSYYAPVFEEVVVQGHHCLPAGFTYENSLHKLRTKIAESSAIQTAKGILTAGAAKSVKYAWSKKMKAWKSH